MKPSRSGTASPVSSSARLSLALFATALLVIAFATSFIFGIWRSGDSPPAVALPDSADVVFAPVQGARVEVLNGAGKAGLARLATDRLRDAGFDVVQFGNAREIALTSSVLDRVGNTGAAIAVGKTLGISNVKTVVDSSRLVDATVILGKDWPLTR